MAGSFQPQFAQVQCVQVDAIATALTTGTAYDKDSARP
ncbi:hypothetical protein QFZ75_005422 [Streptomyces sp. V3I8]|jgi:hypothetical protein|nr:hypothetical protein [Streptomyces sp. V3I8]